MALAALETTTSNRITLSNPYKDHRLLNLSRKYDIRQMVVNGLYEVEKIILDSEQRNERKSQSCDYVWEFDDELPERVEVARQIMTIIKSAGLNISGLRFKEDALNSSKRMKGVIEIAK